MKKYLFIGLLFLSGCGQSVINTIGTGYGLVKITYKLNSTGIENKFYGSDVADRIYTTNGIIAKTLDNAWDIRTTNEDEAKTIAQKAVKDIESLVNELNTLGVK